MSEVKLLYYDKFLESLIKLPQGTQKKVLDFQKKFKKDSKSSGIHLEPISTFKDPSLRSARIDQTYRAILKSFNNGNIYYLMWVDHHDKAYQWASNKVFDWNENTQTVQVFTDPDTTPPPNFRSTNTSEVEGKFSDYSDKELIKLGVPQVLMPAIRNVKNDEDFLELEGYLPEGIYENLFDLLTGGDIEKLISEVEEGKVKDEALEAQMESINNQRNFIELTDDQLLNEVLTGSLEKWKIFLHPEQRKLVNKDYSGSVKVTGGAGTGKTVAAIHRLKFLVEKNPGKEILFTTYTKALTENLIKAAESLKVDLSNVKIANVDAIAFELAQKFKIIPQDSKILEFNSKESAEDLWNMLIDDNLISYDVNFLEAEFSDVILNNNVANLREYLRTSRTGRGKPILRRQRKELWDVFEKYNNLRRGKNYLYKAELFNRVSNYFNENEIRPYEFCIVDELQDFSSVELRLIRSFVEKKRNDLFIVGDPLQKIYDRKLNFTKAGINIRGKKSQRLKVNYRTTEEIKLLAISIVQNCHYDNFEGEEEAKTGYISLRHGARPEYSVFKSKDQEIEYVIEKVKDLINQGYDYSDIVVSSRIKKEYRYFKNNLHQSNIPYYEYERGNLVGDPKGIALMSFHNLKGLEFKHVILVDVNDRNCPYLPHGFETFDETEEESLIRNERSLLYVAISRAVHNVIITGTGRRSEIIKV
jgi:mRNA-degrading endonuclease RelE of RelBE toxin-antitoxin system